MSADAKVTVHADHISIVLKIDVPWSKLSIEARMNLHKRLAELAVELEETLGRDAA